MFTTGIIHRLEVQHNAPLFTSIANLIRMSQFSSDFNQFFRLDGKVALVTGGKSASHRLPVF